MELLLMFAVFVAAMSLMVWVVRSSDRAEAALRKQMLDEIKHLSPEMQARLWAAHMRIEADRDLH